MVRIGKLLGETEKSKRTGKLFDVEECTAIGVVKPICAIVLRGCSKFLGLSFARNEISAFELYQKTEQRTEGVRGVKKKMRWVEFKIGERAETFSLEC